MQKQNASGHCSCLLSLGFVLLAVLMSAILLTLAVLTSAILLTMSSLNQTRETRTGNLIILDPSSNVGTVNPLTWGIGSPGSEQWWGNSPVVTQRIKDAHIKLVRVGAIYYSNSQLGGKTCTSPTQCDFSVLDKIMKSIFDAGAQPLFTIVRYPGGIATDDWNNYATFMSLVVKHYNKDLAVGQKIHYFEMWNEPDNGVDEKMSVNTYEMFIKTVGAAMKAVDPTIKLVAPAAAFADLGQYTGGDGGGGGYLNYVAQHTNDLLDILSWHNYARHDDTEQARLDKEKGMYYDDVVKMLTSPLFVSPTGKHYGAAITEYNMAGGSLANGNDILFHTNYNAAFIASAIINAIRAKANFLTFFTLGGILDYQNNWNPYPPYYTFYLFGNHMGTTLVNGTGGSNRLEYVASKDTDGKTIHVIIVNKDTASSQTGTIVINGAINGSYTQYQIDDTHIPTTSTPGNFTNGQLSFTLPPIGIQAFDIALGVTSNIPIPLYVSPTIYCIGFCSTTTPLPQEITTQPSPLPYSSKINRGGLLQNLLNLLIEFLININPLKLILSLIT